MKFFSKIILILSVILCINNNVTAQAFQKGNKNFDMGIGFGIYGTTQTASTTTNGVTVSKTNSDGAVSTVIPIRFEYGVGEKIGIGAELLFSNYLINDSDRVNLNKIRSSDYGLVFNYHLLNAEKNDLFIGLGIGLSSMKIIYNTSLTQQVESLKGSGLYYSFGITDRIFFSEHIGMLVNLSYRGYNYTSLEADFTPALDAFIAASNTTYSQSWDWSFKGVNLGIGLAVKF